MDDWREATVLSRSRAQQRREAQQRKTLRLWRWVLAVPLVLGVVALLHEVVAPSSPAVVIIGVLLATPWVATWCGWVP